MADFTIKRHDTSPAISATLKDASGVGVSLTAATEVRFLMKLPKATTPKVNAAAQITDAAAGKVKYNWVTGDTDTKGIYNAEFQVTFSTGAVMTFPNSSYISVEVKEDLGP